MIPTVAGYKQIDMSYEYIIDMLPTCGLTKNAQPGKLCIFCRNVFRLALCRFVPRRRGVLLFRSVLWSGSGANPDGVGSLLVQRFDLLAETAENFVDRAETVYGAVFALAACSGRRPRRFALCRRRSGRGSPLRYCRRHGRSPCRAAAGV